MYAKNKASIFNSSKYIAKLKGFFCQKLTDRKGTILDVPKSIDPEKTDELDWGRELPDKFVEFHFAVAKEKLKMSQPNRDKDGHHDFLICLKHKRHIPFNGWRREVEHISANQRGGHLCFRIDAIYTQLVENVDFLLPIKLCQIQYSG